MEGVDVCWHDTSDDPLRDHLRSLGFPSRTARLCPQCGSDAHGVPLSLAGGVHLSLSRCGPVTLTAIADRPVGVDVDALTTAWNWPDDVVLAPGETAGGLLARARSWVRKEAVLKAAHVGLARPMSSVVLSEEQWEDLLAPSGLVAAVAVRRETEAVASGPARR